MEHFRPHDSALGAGKLPVGLSRLSQASTLLKQIYKKLHQQLMFIISLFKFVSFTVRLNYQLPQLISFILLTGANRVTWGYKADSYRERNINIYIF